MMNILTILEKIDWRNMFLILLNGGVTSKRFISFFLRIYIIYLQVEFEYYERGIPSLIDRLLGSITIIGESAIDLILIQILYLLFFNG